MDWDRWDREIDPAERSIDYLDAKLTKHSADARRAGQVVEGIIREYENAIKRGVDDANLDRIRIRIREAIQGVEEAARKAERTYERLKRAIDRLRDLFLSNPFLAGLSGRGSIGRSGFGPPGNPFGDLGGFGV